ncbi:MAG: hypothetical protein GY856_53955 [bacterium]|nr:hypothetical protein [bacterium]
MLEETDWSVAEERSSRKDPFTDAEVRDLLRSVDTVVVAKGKRMATHPASETELDALKGPTGNYRAPMVRKGSTLLVGFHADALEELLG